MDQHDCCIVSTELGQTSCLCTVVGTPPTGIMAQQTGENVVRVSWTAPPDPPSRGYLITANPGGISNTATQSSQTQTLTIREVGIYDIQVESLSQHLSGVAELQGFTVQGEVDPTLVS